MVQHGHGDEEDALPVSFRDVLTAAERLRGKAHRTPVVTARSFDAEAGMRTWLKCELFQRGGAFKFRGAYNKIDSLDPAQRSRGVIAFSSGNHAQAVALCARLFGIPAVICMPTDAPAVKVQATSSYGAEIVLYDRLTEDREALARAIGEQRGLTLVPPYDDPAIIAGQGTVALELLDEVPELDRSEEHTSELQSLTNLVCRLLLEKKKQHEKRIRDEQARSIKSGASWTS